MKFKHLLPILTTLSLQAHADLPLTVDDWLVNKRYLSRLLVVKSRQKIIDRHGCYYYQE